MKPSIAIWLFVSLLLSNRAYAASGPATPLDALQMYAKALSHVEGCRLSDIVAPSHAQEEQFVADHDALTAAKARLRAAAVTRFSDHTTDELAGGLLRAPRDADIRRLLDKIQNDFPATMPDAADEVRLSSAAHEWFAAAALRRNGHWKIRLAEGVARPDVMMAESGDIRSYARELERLADAVT